MNMRFFKYVIWLIFALTSMGITIENIYITTVLITGGKCKVFGCYSYYS